MIKIRNKISKFVLWLLELFQPFFSVHSASFLFRFFVAFSRAYELVMFRVNFGQLFLRGNYSDYTTSKQTAFRCRLKMRGETRQPNINFPAIKNHQNYDHVHKIHKMGIIRQVTDGMLKIIYSVGYFFALLLSSATFVAIF